MRFALNEACETLIGFKLVLARQHYMFEVGCINMAAGSLQTSWTRPQVTALTNQRQLRC